MMDVLDVLVAARDVLQERGWVKGVYEDERGCVCISGAVQMVMFGSTRSPFPDNLPSSVFDLSYEAEVALNRNLPHWARSLEAFNDSDNVTERDVYDLIDRAIAAAEARPDAD